MLYRILSYELNLSASNKIIKSMFELHKLSDLIATLEA